MAEARGFTPYFDNSEAWKIYINRYEHGVPLSAEDQFMVDEALDYLIKEAFPWEGSVYVYNQAMNYYEQGYKELALKYFEYGAKKHNCSLCDTEAGAMCFHGDGILVDYEKAFKYLGKAYEKHRYEKANLLAEMYEKGIYVEKDPVKADEIWEHYYDYFDLQIGFRNE